MAETIAAYWYVIVILLAGVVAAWLYLPGSTRAAPPKKPEIEPAAPQAVADLAREMPKATEPVALVDGAPAPKPAALPKVKAKPAAATPKPKPAPVKTAPAKAAAAPKAKPVPAAAEVATPAAAAPAPKPKSAPKPKPAAAKPAPQPVIPDNLELLKGIGPKLNTLLKSLGVTSFTQVANWSAADIDEIDAKLGVFAGRIRRDNWVDQAKLLVAGDIKGFEKKYGALGSEITG